MNSGTHAIRVKTGLVALLVLAFASQLTFAVAPNRGGNDPSSSRVSERVVVLPEFGVGLGLNLVSPMPAQPKVSDADKDLKSVRTAARKFASRVKFLATSKGVKLPKGKVVTGDCQDGCLAVTLACIAISILSACPACAAVCLGYEVYCLEHCPGEITKVRRRLDGEGK
jgi:hypothetical protein